MVDIIASKGWNWEMIQDDHAEIWKNPAIETFYLLNRWKSQNKCEFLDLGCGLGRHSIFFAKNGFNTRAFDISKDASLRCQKWAEEENLDIKFIIGDMLFLPFNDGELDCILCRNVISHTDTNGIKQIISELKRVLKDDGECYLTLGSKNTWGFKQEWPLVDENTKLCMKEGPEYKVPHFYADYDLIQELFKSFRIELIQHIGDYYKMGDQMNESYHYHLLIKK